MHTSPTPDDKTTEVAPTRTGVDQYGEFAIGFFVSQRVKLAIDNIKVTGWVNGTEADMLRGYQAAEQEPATGDATIYVVIAMAISFVACRPVVTKREREIKYT